MKFFSNFVPIDDVVVGLRAFLTGPAQEVFGGHSCWN